MSLVLLTQDTFNNVRVLRTKHIISLKLFIQAQQGVLQSKLSGALN
jgi:hypothetical protein